MPTKQEIAAREALRRRDVRLRELVARVAGMIGDDVDLAVKVARTALNLAVDAIRAEANDIADSKRSGHVTVTREMRQGAARMAGLSLALEKLPVADVVPTGEGAVPSIDVESAEAAAERKLAEAATDDDDQGPSMAVLEGELPSDPGGPLRPGEPAYDGHYAPGVAPLIVGTAGELVDPFGDPVELSEDGFADPVVVEGAIDPFADPTGPGSRQRASWDEFESLLGLLWPSHDPGHISVSQVEGIAECGTRYAFDRLARVGLVDGERLQWSTIAGTAFHSVIRLVEDLHLLGVDWHPVDDVETIRNVWTAQLDKQAAEELDGTRWQLRDIRASAKGLEGYDWWRVAGADMVAKYVAHHDEAYRFDHAIMLLGRTEPGAARLPAIETEFDMPIEPLLAHKITVNGKLDSLWWDGPAGGAMLVDWKSGKRAGSAFQRAVYSHAAMRVLGIPGPIISANWDARNARYVHVGDATRLYSWDAVAAAFTRADAIRRQRLFLPRPSTFCGGCTHEAICPARYGQ